MTIVGSLMVIGCRIVSARGWRWAEPDDVLRNTEVVVLNWLMLALVSGLPTGFQSSDLNALVSGLSTDTHLLESALEQRVSDLSDIGRADLAEDSLRLLAPLAERIGLGHKRAALEDEAFRVLEPDAYQALAEQLPSPEEDASVLASLRTAVASHAPSTAKVDARVKSLWSLQKKMKRKDVDVDGVFDRLALRVVLENEEECYASLAHLLAHYSSVPGELDDYITTPKASGYQALHVALQIPVQGRWVTAEVQLKTTQMHEMAESGDAAHWRYKAA